MEYEERAQLPYRSRLEWARDGVLRAAARGDVVAIVDTLRFSTAVTAAVAKEAVIHPCIDQKEVDVLLGRIRAEEGGRKAVIFGYGALCPSIYDDVQPGTQVLLPSPNGATCTRYGADSPLLLVGALINAEAVAEVISVFLDGGNLRVTVVACGERRGSPGEDGSLRFAVEDYLGAGAILSHLGCSKSPEALVCQAAFEGTCNGIAGLLWESVSGQELRDKGLGHDVAYAAQLNSCSAVAMLHGGRLVALDSQNSMLRAWGFSRP